MATMTRNLLRTSLLAGLAAGSFLIASPARADSITPERALLGRIGAGRASAPDTSSSSVADKERIDGQAALLNRRAVTGDRSSGDGADRIAAGNAALPGASRNGAAALLSHSI